MNIKKIYSSVLALGLAFTLASCNQSKTDSTANYTESKDKKVENSTDKTKENQVVDENAKKELDSFKSEISDDTLVIGVGSLNGEFIQGFGNDMNDVSARRLMGIQGPNGYDTYVQDESGQWQLNKVVCEKEPEIVDNADGSKTVKYQIKKGLKWSDGQELTANDYLFYALLESDASFIPVTGSLNPGANTLVGYKDFHSGKSDKFEGLSKIDDYSFAMTISADEIPYFDFQALVGASPLPMHYIAPNLKVADDGKSLIVKDGYKVSDQDKKDFKNNINQQIAQADEAFNSLKKPADDAKKEVKDQYEKAKKDHDDKVKDLKARLEGDVDPTRLLIDTAMLKETQDYRFNPAVVCGPYKFDSYENNMAKLSLNENYAGNFKNDKATIPHVILQVVNANIAADLVINGDIDIWEDETQGAKIDQLKKAADEGKIKVGSYERNGYGSLNFLVDRGPTKYKEVRKAIASLMDRNNFVQSYAGGYGVVTNGMYGTSQWMYKERGADIEQKLINYQLNLEEASKLLDKTPYKFEADGKTPWDKKKADEAFAKDADKFDYYRYDENGKKLVVNQYGSEESPITTLISNQVPVNAKQVGMEYNVTSGSFATLTELYQYPKEDAEYTAFNMGTGFGTPFDPWYYYSKEGPFNRAKVNDPKADEITTNLRRTDPKDKEGYLDKWEEFQIWYNDFLPEIPLYSNIFHTGYSNRVKGFDIMAPEWHAYDQINALKLEK